MAGKKDGKREVPLEQLEAEFNETIARIRRILAGKKDRNELRDEDRRRLRTEYSAGLSQA